MAIPSGTTKVVFGGLAPQGEVWETGFWVGGAPVASNTDANDFCNDLVGILNASGHTFAELSAWLAGDSDISFLRSYTYLGGASAAYIGVATAFARAGTSGSNSPLQQCVVATLQTGHAGRSYRGRMYLPANGRTLSGGHVFSSASVDGLAVALGTDLTAVNTLVSPGNVIIVSQTATLTTDVTTVRIDNKPDIQRRRANGFLPTYSKSQAL